MIKKVRVLALIPARGGSRGIPRKNIVPVCGKPLIVYTIQAALESKRVTETYVSSEDREILEISRRFGAQTIMRPAGFATDTASMESVILDALAQLGDMGKEFEVLVLLQPTSPLRTAQDIDGALHDFFEKGASALISVYEPEHTPFKAFRLDDNCFLRGLVDDRAPFMRRQDLPRAFFSNGAIYIIRTGLFLKNQSLFADRTLPFVMPAERSIDLDRPEDIAVIERQLRGR